jgi:hypothetical protein
MSHSRNILMILIARNQQDSMPAGLFGLRQKLISDVGVCGKSSRAVRAHTVSSRHVMHKLKELVLTGAVRRELGHNAEVGASRASTTLDEVAVVIGGIITPAQTHDVIDSASYECEGGQVGWGWFGLRNCRAVVRRN